MNRLLVTALFSGVSCFATVAFAQSTGTAPQENAAETPSGGIVDIVVTAQKREERLQDVPVAVSVLTMEQIQEQRIQDVTDLRSMIPSLFTTPNPSGGQAIVSLRGSLSSSAPNPGADPSISFYIDGVYLGGLTGSYLDVSDIERIEVIRGPAGTLFGTNATGGAINYITSRPKGILYAKQELSYARFGSFRSKTRLDLPEWKGFSASFNYLHNFRGNNIHNINRYTWDTSAVGLGAPASVKSAAKLGWSETDAFHAAIRYRPFDDLTVDYSFDYSRRRDPGPGMQLIGFYDGANGDFARGTIIGSSFFGGPPLSSILQQSRSTQVYNGLSNVPETVAKSHFVSVDYRANDYLSIKNITSWRDIKHEFRMNQLDGLGSLMLPNGANGPQPFTVLSFYDGENRHEFSNETQFNVRTQPLDVTAGLFYYKRAVPAGEYYYQLFSFVPFNNFTIPGLAPGREQTAFRTRQVAGYGQATFHVTPKLDLTGGIRYAQDSKNVVDGSVTPARTTNFESGKFTYLGTLSYKFDDNVLAYAKYSTGFVAGGLVILTGVATDPAVGGGQFAASSTVPYNSETVRSTEIGLKADFFDRRLRTNFAIYHAAYGNVQVANSITVPVIAPSGQTTTLTGFGLLNSGTARNNGIEYEITAVPIRGLTLTASGAYNDFKYGSGSNIGNPTQRPKFTANLGAEYEMGVGGGDMRLALRGDANYRSSVLLSNVGPFSEDPVTRPEGARLNELVNSAPLWMLNARVSLKDVPLGPTKARVSVWGRNLLNKQLLSSAASLGTVLVGTFDDPVTYGIDLAVEF